MLHLASKPLTVRAFCTFNKSLFENYEECHPVQRSQPRHPVADVLGLSNSALQPPLGPLLSAPIAMAENHNQKYPTVLYGLDNPHPVSQLKTELVWNGKMWCLWQLPRDGHCGGRDTAAID